MVDFMTSSIGFWGYQRKTLKSTQKDAKINAKIFSVDFSVR